jgi:DNA helicase-2/ATP-dependent DNA helicase PcrA
MTFFKELNHNANIQFNEEQQAAINHITGPALTLAVPGSGKTTLLLSRTINLVHNHKVPANRILSMTFSKAAAKDMQTRFHKTFYKFYPYDVKFSTIHSFSYRIFNAYNRKHKKSYTLLEGHPNFSKNFILSDVFKKINKSMISEDELESLMNQISFYSNMMLLPTEKVEGIDRVQNLDKIILEYKKFKEDNGLIDFDDMLIKALHYLQTDENLLKTVQDSFDYLQVDETQDTSKLQHEILKLISRPNNNIFAVADDDQSIYGFRGAYPKMILHFDKAYPGCKTYYLRNNYRSSEKIIDVCKNSISKNKERHEKEMVAINDYDSEVSLLHFDDTNLRNMHLVDYIKKHDNQSIGILYRNNLSAVSIVDKFSDANIDFSISDMKKDFLRHWITKDLFAFYKLSVNPADIESFEKICFKTNGFISHKILDYVRLNQRDRDVFDVILGFPELKKKHRSRIIELQKGFYHANTLSAYDFINHVEINLGYHGYLSYTIENRGHSKNAVNTYLDMLKNIAKGTTGSENDVEYFFDKLESISKAVRNNSFTNSLVNLSTMHSSKGQEYDTVFIVDAAETVIPYNPSNKSLKIHEIEEERRLFYVAISRPKKNLFFLHTKMVNGKYAAASKFINEISKNFSPQKKNGNSSKNYNDLSIGSKIHHKTTGMGTIVDINRTIATIDFSGTIKKFDIEICMKNNIIQLL